ncbi:MAG: endonuclease/exonuclease/phosphatase family protein [Kofleriaceae bacterium]
MSQLRVVTLNFWGTEPPLERRIELATRQLRALDPDVVCVQEVKPYRGGTTAHAIGEALGMHAHYETACAWQAGERGSATAGEEGLAIVTRAPLVAHEVTRLPSHHALDDARILVSGLVATIGGPIWVHTTHLNYRLDDGVSREAQVLAIDAKLRERRGLADPPQILCGDFNATPDSDEIRFLRGLTTLAGRRTHFQDAWLRLHREAEPGDGPGEGITWSSENELTRPLRSLDIDRRIDYVFVTSRKKDGRGTVMRSEVVLAERDGGVCASDHYAVLAEIQVVTSS